MNLEVLRNNSDKILDCEIKDESGLNDFQKLPDKTALAIDEVGIERFRIPLKFQHADGEILNHDCVASMFIYLQEGKTGANMSRFCNVLQEEAMNSAVDSSFINKVLYRFRKDLRDFEDEALIPQSKLELKFSYPLKQKSLKSDNWGWQYYDVKFSASQTDEETLIRLTLNYEYSSTCPCSLSMSKQYENEFKDGVTNQGSGIASAHSQRSLATVTTTIDPGSNFKVEDLIQLARTAIPTETQSFVKRIDEQEFAILNGDNPMFVEHATRRFSLVLDSDERIFDWKVKVEHFESLHSHNAVAFIRKRK